MQAGLTLRGCRTLRRMGQDRVDAVLQPVVVQVLILRQALKLLESQFNSGCPAVMCDVTIHEVVLLFDIAVDCIPYESCHTVLET